MPAELAARALGSADVVCEFHLNFTYVHLSHLARGLQTVELGNGTLGK